MLLLFRLSKKPLTTKPTSSSTLNLLSTPSTRDQVKSRAPCDGVHRIRVDFKRDHDVEKVWEAGGLSLLTSVPITPRVLCFLCASSGNVEVRKITTLWKYLYPSNQFATKKWQTLSLLNKVCVAKHTIPTSGSIRLEHWCSQSIQYNWAEATNQRKTKFLSKMGTIHV